MNEIEGTGKVKITGVIEYRDADGNVIESVPMEGTVLVEDEEVNDGSQLQQRG
jgi:hypothetical protein